MMMDKNVARKMTEANALGMSVDQFSVGDLEELEAIHEVYNDEEQRLIDAMADSLIALYELGDCSPARSTDAREFGNMIDELCEAKTSEEYDMTLGCYGDLGRNKAVQAYVAFKKSKLSA